VREITDESPDAGGPVRNIRNSNFKEKIVIF